jgi:hypothetical protein
MRAHASTHLLIWQQLRLCVDEQGVGAGPRPLKKVLGKGAVKPAPLLALQAGTACSVWCGML